MTFRKSTGSFKIPDRVPRRLKRELHRQIGGDIVANSKEAFRYERWIGRNGRRTTWPERKKNYPWPKLKKSRTMFNSIRRRSIDTSDVVVVSPDPRLPYPPVHNFGLRSGRGRGFIMPQRQFLGESANLDKRIKRRIYRFYDKIFTGRR